MISVVIATHDSEALLVPTLAALVPGALAGIVREVIVADGGSRDATAKVADVAGCRFELVEGALGARLIAGAEAARAQWLLFLQPGVVLDPTWVDDATRFMQQVPVVDAAGARAAVFRPSAHAGHSAIAEALALIAAALIARVSPEQGLLIAKRHYQELGGYRVDRPDPERDLLRRLGRRRIVTLRSAAVMVAA
jgi:glycosyltransferase involved in cell wall biosynthesis